MASRKLNRVRIRHRQRDGYHLLTSPDVPGLLLSSKDLARALLQLPGLIETLLYANRGIACRVELSAPPPVLPPSEIELLPAA
jgi:hypothetical protein